MRTTKTASALLGLLAAAGCSSFSERWSEKMDDPMSLPRMLIAGTNVPPGTQRPSGAVVQPGATRVVLATPEDAYCPPIGVAEGGAVIQVGGRSGEASSVRSQVTLGQLARECLGQADGSTLVKVGVQGRALLGAGGGAGRYDVPLRVVVRQGDRVFANRVRRMTIQIPPGDTQGSVTIVEDRIVVPAAAADDFRIEVGLGGAPGSRRG
jgi:hypothetical protein